MLHESTGNFHQDKVSTYSDVFRDLVLGPVPTLSKESLHSVSVDGTRQPVLVYDFLDCDRIYADA